MKAKKKKFVFKEIRKKANCLKCDVWYIIIKQMQKYKLKSSETKSKWGLERKIQTDFIIYTTIKNDEE